MTRRALIVIDVQNEYETGALPIAHPPLAESLPNVGRAMDAARAAGALVVVVQHDSPAGSLAFAVGSHGWELHDVVASRAADHLVHKTLPGSFTGTDLEAWLRDRGVTTVTLVGYMTQHCVDTTARQAFHAGFTVEVVCTLWRMPQSLLPIRRWADLLDRSPSASFPCAGNSHRWGTCPYASRPARWRRSAVSRSRASCR